MQKILRKRRKETLLYDTLNEDVVQDAFPPSPEPNVKTNKVMYQVYKYKLIEKAYSDFTWQILCRSSRENEHILVGYHFDCNVIEATPIRNNQSRTIK